MRHLNKILELLVHTSQTYIRNVHMQYSFTPTVKNIQKTIFEVIPENCNVNRISS